jgi:hypothetical protein
MHKLHIPTEQYGFAEIEFEGTAEEALAEYKRLTTDGIGMEHKAFLALGDELYKTKSMQADPGIMESMSKTQHDCIRFLSLMQKRND